MSSFLVQGARNGSTVRVRWTDGQLSGDPPTLALIEVAAELALTSPEDPHSWSRIVDPEGTMPVEPLADPGAAWRLIESVLDTVQSAEGDLPPEAADALRRRNRS